MRNILSSYVATIVLLALYAICMATATFVEKAWGTAIAKLAIYYSPLFFLLQIALATNFVMIAIRYRLFKQKRWGILSVHLSFIIILTGALVTHLFGKEGVLHLREGESDNRIAVQTNRGHSFFTLPFQVELIKFTLTRYPGSTSPSSFESELFVHVDGKSRRERVFMNNVLDVKGYRFFQASYDTDEKGTILSVNQDVAGRTITYAGYFLLLTGFILCFVDKNGRIRSLYRQLGKMDAINRKQHNDLSPRRTQIAEPPTLPISVASRCDEVKSKRPRLPSVSLLFLFSGFTVCLNAAEIPRTHAERFGALPVQSSTGRIIPVNTFSSEILRKLNKNTDINGMNSDQFLLSLLAMPEEWMRVPLIVNNNDAIADYFGFPRRKCAYIDLFSGDGAYKLQSKLNEAYRKMPAERAGFDKDIIKIDEKANVLHQLLEHQLIRLFPKVDDPAQQWYAPGDDLSVFDGQDSMFVARVFDWYISEVQDALKSNDWSKPNEILDMISTYQTAKNNVPESSGERLGLELTYNRLNIFRWCKIAYLSLGGLLLLFSFILIFGFKPLGKWIVKILGVGILFIFHFHMLGMGMRWKIGGYAPWSNSYETMVFMAWAVVLGGLLFARRSVVVFSLSAFFAGIVLFVSGLSWLDPQINPLVPVLKSPWLMFHVAFLMIAYGFFGIGFLIGLFNLFLMAFAGKKQEGSIRELSIINEISLIAGLILMTVGTFMGAVWANESWGRYWGWDPKETWALITMIVYALVTHLHLVKKWYSLKLFNLFSVMAFVSVLMTYFGVNYFLSGMHSYGQ